MKEGAASLAVALLAITISTTVYSWDGATPLIIDHTCTGLSTIPDEWIDSVQANLRMHYVHASHGAQLTCGLQLLEGMDSKYGVAIGSQYLPTESNAFNIYDKEGDPDMYWFEGQYNNGMEITRGILNANPTINVSMFMWCVQLYSSNPEGMPNEEYVEAYLENVSTLESEFPDVTFIYATSHAQYCIDTEYDIYGHLRYLADERIRQYCLENNKVLFDFADLDSWWFNPSSQEWEHTTCTTEGYTIPIQHSHYEYPHDCGHANNACCEQKGRALWWMLAKIAGWTGEGANRPPVLNAIGEQTVDEGDTLILQVTASDPDSDPITLSASPVPPNATFTDQRDGTGDFFFTPDSTQAGSYEIVFTASDGEYSDSERVVISVTTVGLEESIIEIPESASGILRVCPNPFTNAATLAYTLGSESAVRVEVYSSHGRLMRTLCEGRQSPGLHEIRWTSGDLPSGVYFLKLETDQYSSTEKAVLTR